MFTTKTILTGAVLSMAVMAVSPAAHAMSGSSTDPYVNTVIGARESYPNMNPYNCADILTSGKNFYSESEWKDRKAYCKEMRIHNAMSIKDLKGIERSPSAGGNDNYEQSDSRYEGTRPMVHTDSSRY